MHEHSLVTPQRESHLLRGLFPALNPICSMQTFRAPKPTRGSTNRKADLLPRWLVLLPALHGSFAAIATRAVDGT